MKRLYLTVEGQTEAAFAWHPRSNATGLSRGSLRLPLIASALFSWLVIKEDQAGDARFSMMVDLYSLPNDFPGYAAGMAKGTGREKADALQQSLAEVMADARFVPYLQCHEFEALVLVDPARIGTLYDVPNAHLQALCQDCAAFATAEEINLGQQSHPKSRIEEKVPGYDENVAGPRLAEDIGLATLRVRCPHFGEWLTRLEQLDDAGA